MSLVVGIEQFWVFNEVQASNSFADQNVPLEVVDSVLSDQVSTCLIDPTDCNLLRGRNWNNSLRSRLTNLAVNCSVVHGDGLWLSTLYVACDTCKDILQRIGGWTCAVQHLPRVDIFVSVLVGEHAEVSLGQIFTLHLGCVSKFNAIVSQEYSWALTPMVRLALSPGRLSLADL